MKLKGNYKASNFFMKRGIIMDLDKNCYEVENKLFSFIPLNTKCEKIPKIEYLLMFKTLYAKCEACELEDFESGSGSVLQLSIVYNKNRRLIVHETKNKKEIAEKANLLAEHFHVKIKDAATNRKAASWHTAL